MAETRSAAADSIPNVDCVGLTFQRCVAAAAPKLLAEIGPVDRFKRDAQLARHAGVAPPEASSGRTQRQRLDRGGNRQLNAALYRIAITQARYYAPAREYLERKRAEGKSRREAIRCLKRQLARAVFNTLKSDSSLDIGATLAHHRDALTNPPRRDE